MMGDEQAAQNFIRAAALVAVILPSAATAETRGEMRELETILSSAKPLGSCQAIGFEVNWDTLGGKIDSLVTRLVNSGVSEEDIARLTQEASAESDRLLPLLKVPDLSQGNPREAFDEVEAVFTTIQRRCDELTNEPELSAHITQGPYQREAGTKSLLGLFRYYADQGDADKMVVVGSLYAAGVKPDPDNKLEFMWFKRAADQGYPQAARRVAVAYLLGRGVAKDMTDAVKWAVISESLGGGSFEIQNIEPKATVVQRELGRQRAAAWLEARR